MKAAGAAIGAGLLAVSLGVLLFVGIVPAFATINSYNGPSTYGVSWVSRDTGVSYALPNGGSVTVGYQYGHLLPIVTAGDSKVVSSCSITIQGAVYGAGYCTGTYSATTNQFTLSIGQDNTFPQGVAVPVSFTMTDGNGLTVSPWAATVTYQPPAFTTTSYYILDGGAPKSLTSTTSVTLTPSDTVSFEIVAGGTTGYSVTSTVACAATAGTCPAVTMSATASPPTGSCPTGSTCFISNAVSFPKGTYTVTGTVTGTGLPVVTAFSIFGNIGTGGTSFSAGQLQGSAFAGVGLILLAFGIREKEEE